MHAFDRQTGEQKDGQTDGKTAFSSLDRVACNACSAVKTRLVWMGAGLERLQQLMDAMVDDGLMIRQHIYRVRNARDAHHTVQRHRSVDWRLDETSKHILVDLPTKQCEEFLKLQVYGTLLRLAAIITDVTDVIRGFAFMRYINPRLIDWLIDVKYRQKEFVKTLKRKTWNVE